jgi:predicted component of type VI protein secretion system
MAQDNTEQAPQDAPECDPHQPPAEPENAQPDASHAAVEPAADPQPVDLTPDDVQAAHEAIGQVRLLHAVTLAALERRRAQLDRAAQLGSCRDCHAHASAGNPQGHGDHAADYAAAHRALAAAERALDAACNAVLALDSDG